MSAYKHLWHSHRGYSQRERLVRFLAARPDWHSIMDIHREVGFCRLNSRVAEARKVFRRDGHPFDIVHSIRDGVHGYELVLLAGGGNVAASRPEASELAGPVLGRDSRRAAEKPAGVPPSASGSNLQSGNPTPTEDGPLVLHWQGRLL